MDKIKRKVVCQPLLEGGLNFVNLRIMVKTLRLAWIGRLLTVIPKTTGKPYQIIISINMGLTFLNVIIILTNYSKDNKSDLIFLE